MEIRNYSIGPTSSFSWAVAIFAARETAHELMCTVNSVIKASNESTIIDVMVNGNSTLATATAELLNKDTPASTSLVIRVWSIMLGDKAHAWNQYVHAVWPRAHLSFFVDGYVCVKPDAFNLLAERLAVLPKSLGGTGVPTIGRSAAKLRDRMLTEGGMHGNLFALKEPVMDQLRQSCFNLPLGIYRTDSTLGAALAFGLDPSQHQWDIKNRIFVHPEVTWSTTERKWWRYAEVKSQIKRILRQSQGILENRAIENFLAHRRLAPADLPQTASELVLEWVSRCPDNAKSILWNSPLSRIALRKFRSPRDWSDARQIPELVCTWPDKTSIRSL